jgi:large subunit ribosomal protein L4
MNHIPIFSIDLYRSQIKHIENIDIYKILTFTIKKHVIVEIIHWYRASARKGCSKALSKGEVSGTGKKPFAQKGRGVARQGSLRNPHQRGGGVAFPPKNREYTYKVNKKKKRLALQSIFITRLKENRIRVVDKIDVQTPSSKVLGDLIKSLSLKKVLFVDIENPNLNLSLRNISNANFSRLDKINTLKIALYPHIIITKYALSKFILNFFSKFTR